METGDWRLWEEPSNARIVELPGPAPILAIRDVMQSIKHARGQNTVENVPASVWVFQVIQELPRSRIGMMFINHWRVVFFNSHYFQLGE